MKILVIQLARLGDIYQTWPALHALKRVNPGASIHLLTRAKFAPAAPSFVDRVWRLDTRDILAPLIDERPDLDGSIDKADTFASALKAEGFDKIINLTFSPFSSFLTRRIAGPGCEVAGYTRFDDGYLSIPDDGSAYFYAQVGTRKSNRLHLVDLFAYVAGVELTEADWAGIVPKNRPVANQVLMDRIGSNPIVIHPGASDLGKTLTWSKWLQVVKNVLEEHEGEVVIIGAPEEAEMAEKIASVSSDRDAINLVGRTNLEELFDIIARAKVLIGGDSAPVQIATLTGTPVLNLSMPMVSFWETGPRSAKSRILRIESEDDVAASEIAVEAVAMARNQPTRTPTVRVLGPMYPYVEMRPQPGAFQWELLRAIYMSEPFPAPMSELFVTGMKRLADVNQLALEQIATLRMNPRNKIASEILDRVDPIMEQIVGMVPELAPVVEWFRTERLRLGPMPIEHLIERTDAVHRRLADVVGLYVPTEDGGGNQGIQTEGGSHDDVVLG
jgi:ADP-heptose:LPS heptosyltransferase